MSPNSPYISGAVIVTGMRRYTSTAVYENATSWEALAVSAKSPMRFHAGASADPYYTNREQHGVVPANVKAMPSLKFVCLVPRPAHISPNLFHEHWLEKHSQLARSTAGALRMKRYVQSHVIASPTIDGFGDGRDWTPNPYSGMTEVWWDSEEEMAAAFSSQEGQEASRILAEDERNITDGHVIVWAAREYEIFDFTKN
jgi:uncharacterized protein (TIGR02118 family)